MRNSTESRNSKIVNYILSTGAFFIILFGIVSILNENKSLSIALFLAALSVILLYYIFNRSKNFKAAVIIVPLIFASFYLYLFSSGASSGSGHLWAFTFPPVVMFLMGSKNGIISSILLILASYLLFYMNLTINYSVEFIIRYVGALAGLTFVSFFLERTREQMQKNVELKNNRLTSSLEEIKRKDLELQEYARRYKVLFESSSESVLIISDYSINKFNPITLKLFQCKEECFSKKSIWELFSNNSFNYTSDQEIKKFFEDAQNGRVINFEAVLKKCSGEVFNAELTINRIDWYNENTLLCNIRDITDQKNAEQILVEAKEKAVNSEKMKGDFLAQMSHEIRTPINTILNYSSLLKSEFEDKLNDEFKGSFDSIENAANRLLRTIDMILSISEIESGSYTPQLEKIDLVKQVINPIINEFKHEAINKNLVLNFENNTTENIFVTADLYSVNQLLANLIHNSIKYTLNGRISVSLMDGNGRKTIEVADTGIGIAEEYIPKLFEKFSQEEEGYTRKFEGSGLGLALVKQYCDVNNAEISVSSKKGAGTKFTITFSN